MNSKSYVAVVIALTILVSLVLSSAGHPFLTYASETRNSQLLDYAQQAPLMFIENVGQFDPRARFQVRGAGETLWLAEDAIWITVVEEEEEKSGSGGEWEPLSQSHPRSPAHGVNIRLTFPGANPHPRLEPFDRLDTTVSYFTGNDPAGWRADVPVWSGVRYVDLYPGVDLEMSSQTGRWKWRLTLQSPIASDETGWTVSPVLQIDGVRDATADNDRLHLNTVVGQFDLPSLDFNHGALGKPMTVTVQTFAASNSTMAAALATPSSAAPSLRVPDDDPGDLLYGTFLGGSSDDLGYAIAVDAAGDAYTTGQTSSSDFPTTPGAFDIEMDGGDAFVAKLNAEGTALVYATFLGGSNGDTSFGLVVDQSGAAYVAGRTSSLDFPVTTGAFDTSHNGDDDAFVAKLTSDGADLVYATFLGANKIDFARGLALANSGNVFVTGTTVSPSFPTTPGAFDTTCGSDGNCNFNGSLGRSDAFVVKLDADGSDLLYATFLGGHDSDGGSAVATDDTDSAYVTGNTASSDFPVTPGAYDVTYNGSAPFFSGDAFVVKLNDAGSDLVYSTFLGSPGGEGGRALAVNENGDAVVTGLTDSPGFPATPGAYDTSYNGGPLEFCCDAFVARLTANGAGLTFSTFLGGIGWDEGNAIALDAVGNVTVAGGTGSPNFPTTPNAFDTTFNGVFYGDDYWYQDAFVSRLDASGSNLVYSTYLGVARGYGVAMDQAGQVFVTGDAYVLDEAYGPEFPTTPGAFDTTYNGGFNDAFVAKLNLNEPTAIRLAGLAAGAADPAAKLPLGLLVAGALALAFFAVRYRRSRPPSISGATPPHNN